MREFPGNSIVRMLEATEIDVTELLSVKVQLFINFALNTFLIWLELNFYHRTWLIISDNLKNTFLVIIKLVDRDAHLLHLPKKYKKKKNSIRNNTTCRDQAHNHHMNNEVIDTPTNQRD